MSELLKGATLVDLTPPQVSREDLRIEGGTIVERGPALEPLPSELVTDLSGRLVMPGLVNAHTHLYASLTRGLPPPKKPLKSFRDFLEQVWWKLDRALDQRTLQLAAQAGAAESLMSGVTTLFDLHSSPGCVEGSLTLLGRALASVGARGVVSYAISDRAGKPARDAALRETESFLKAGRNPRLQAMVGGDASLVLNPDTLEQMVALGAAHGVGVHLHVAESPEDERDARKRFEKGVIDRLEAAKLLNTRAILANCTHLAWEELALAQQRGCWMIHNPRSNMHNSVGYAPSGKFGIRKGLGTDGLTADVFGEAQFAYLKAREAGFPADALQWLAGGQRLAGEVFGVPLGVLTPGAAADLVVLDYTPATPLLAETLAAHLAMGLGSGHVDAVMVDGAWRVWARQLLGLDCGELCAKAAEAAPALWSRLAEL